MFITSTSEMKHGDSYFGPQCSSKRRRSNISSGFAYIDDCSQASNAAAAAAAAANCLVCYRAQWMTFPSGYIGWLSTDSLKLKWCPKVSSTAQ